MAISGAEEGSDPGPATVGKIGPDECSQDAATAGPAQWGASVWELSGAVGQRRSVVMWVQSWVFLGDSVRSTFLVNTIINAFNK